MAHYIDKDALVAEIKRRRKLVSDPILSGDDLMIGERNALFNLLSFIDTLEVKEVDLDKYINKYFKGWYVDLTDQGNILHSPDGQAGLMSVKKVAKHFFELGLKTQKGK